MCGIVAIVDFNNQIRREVLGEMTSRLSHRGPDGTSVWTNKAGNAGLGHTRLAVIDLATGDQPIHSPDGRYSIVLNGEIYNYQDLRKELIRHGSSFTTESDTEVLLSAYIMWGAECLGRISGMFAFAIYDAITNSLFVARDRTGVKPLYVHSDGRRVIVASELKAILAEDSIERHLNPRAVADLLTLSYCRAPETFYKQISELKPGSWTRFSADNIKRESFWSWRRDETARTFYESVSLTQSALIDSVADHLVADVPVGAFLSSGVDSSLISAIATKELGYQLRTFTIGFDFQGYDESPNAERIARHLGTDHQTLMLSPENVGVDLLFAVLRQFDQPFGDSSAVPAYVLSQLVSNQVKVVLSGDGGDEMFGGYPRFFHADLTRRAYSLFGPLAYSGYPMAWLLGRVSPKYYRVARRMLNATVQRGTDRLTWFANYVTPDELEDVLAPSLFGRLDGYRPSLIDQGSAKQADASDFIDITVNSVLPSDYLRKTDIASSAHGLEVRVPFLGNQVLELSASLPKSHLYRRNRSKRIPRALLRRYLPESLCELPKSGFNIPLMRVLSTDDRNMLASKLTSSEPLRELISPHYIQEIATAFSGRQWNARKHSEFMIYQRFYALLALTVWIEECKPVI